MPLTEQIEQHASASPDKLAFVLGDQTRTFSDLWAKSQSFAAYLRSLPGNRAALPLLNRVDKLVVLSLGNHIQFPELFIAATEWPFACTVLDPSMKSAQVTEIFTRLQPDLIITASEDAGEAEVARSRGLSVMTAAEVEHCALRNRAEDKRETTGTFDDTFLVSFTSGTTSLPKAFTRSRHSWRTSLDRSCALFELENSPSAICPGAFAHGLALYALTETLYSGGTFYAVREWNAGVVASILATGDVQRLIAVPTMIASLAKAAGRALHAFPSVKEVLTAGSKLNLSELEHMTRQFPAARIMEYYGASELGFVSVSRLHPADPATPVETVGKAFPGVKISIRDSRGEDLGAGAPGTIYVESELIADGYLWGDDGKAFRVDAAGATVGDVGELDRGGALRVLGREGGLVITGGFNVYPSEVENVLKSLSGIEEAIVLGVDDSYLGKRLVAVVQGDFSCLETVVAQAGETLARHKVPREFYRVDAWPLTTSGKVARKHVEELLLEGAYERVQVSA